MATDRVTYYCDLCHTTCLTCYGPLLTNCITCPSSFTLDSGNSTCLLPNSATEKAIIQAYYIEGFTALTGWVFSGFSTTTYQCGLRTLLGGTVNDFTIDSISIPLSGLPNHFKLRVKCSYYFLNSNGVNKNATITIGANSNLSTGD